MVVGDAPLGFFARVGPRGDIQVLCPRAVGPMADATVLGVPVRGLDGRSAFEVWGDVPPLIEALRSALGGAAATVEFEALGAWWEIRAAPERDDDDVGSGATVLILDQTPRKRAEEDARRALTFLDSLIENLPDMIFVKRAEDLRFVRFNRAAEELLGYSRAEMIGKNDHDLFPAKEADFFTDRDRCVLRSGQLVDTPEEPIHTRERGTRILHTKKIPIYDATGAPLYLLGIAEDITDKQRVDAERRALEGLRTELIANVSHELRTPLALIEVHLSRLVRRPGIDDAARADVDAISRHARDLLGLVDDVLDLARSQAGKLAADYADVDLGLLVSQVAASFGALAAAKGIDLVIDAAEVRAEVDADKIQRAVTNLLANALRHTPAGGRVRCVAQRSEDRARIVVADSGPGIPLAQRERAFERFFQVEGDPLRAGGTGLGLALVKDTVDLHGGSITVGDGPDGGAQLVVELPLAAPAGVVVRSLDARDAGLVPLRPASPALAPVQRTGGPLVLVVEDHLEFNRVLAETLSEQYRVATAFDGEEGLARARELAPDLIVTDLMMPRMSGEEMITAIRAQPALDAVPIVVLTAKNDEAVRLRLLRGGAQDYVMKPFPAGELMARVANLISLKRARDVLRRELASSHDDVAELADDLALRNRHARFLADAGAALARSLDDRTTLVEVASLAVPDVADACAIDLIEPDESLRRVAVAPPTPEASRLLADPASTTEVPLVARGRRLGSLTFGWSTAARRDDPVNVALARDLAGRAAMAIDNARLYLDAQTAVGLRDEFLSVASHELRTPLTPLVMSLQALDDALLKDTSPELRHKMVSVAVRQVERLTTLVDQLLDATRIGFGALRLEREELELGAVVQGVVDGFAPQLARAGCATTVTHGQPVIGCWDKDRIEQVVESLLSNAVKFAGGEPIELTVDVVGDRARLVIHDRGIGIAPARQPHIFERFERAVPTRNYGGLGLGLYISKSIVEAHGGTIAVESSPGYGTTFTVELPR